MLRRPENLDAKRILKERKKKSSKKSGTRKKKSVNTEVTTPVESKVKRKYTKRTKEQIEETKARKKLKEELNSEHQSFSTELQHLKTNQKNQPYTTYHRTNKKVTIKLCLNNETIETDILNQTGKGYAIKKQLGNIPTPVLIGTTNSYNDAISFIDSVLQFEGPCKMEMQLYRFEPQDQSYDLVKTEKASLTYDPDQHHCVHNMVETLDIERPTQREEEDFELFSTLAAHESYDCLKEEMYNDDDSIGDESVDYDGD